MNHSLDDTATEPRQRHAPRSGRLRFELVFAAGALAFGLFVLPALIYSVGVALLGPYGTEDSAAGWGTFYGDFFADLTVPVARAWAIALGPLILITVWRAVFLGVRRKARADPSMADPATRDRSPGTPRQASGDTRSGRSRRTPRLSPGMDTHDDASGKPVPPATSPAITAERPATASRAGAARPAPQPGRIEPRVGPD